MRRFEAREQRFSNRVLLTYASNSLPELLGLRLATDNEPAEILLYDEIGMWGITASDFAAALSKAGDGPITLRINSPGGDVFDGYAIYNMLRGRHAPVNVVVDGLAASAASFIAMAGSTIAMGEASMLMIHNSWGLCVGDRHDMLDMAATQEKIDGQIAAIYAAKSGMSVENLAGMMDDETWLTSSEALDQKLCDSVLSPATQSAANASRSKLSASVKTLPRLGARIRDAVAPYDPDGDGDNDAEEAIEKLNTAAGLISSAIASLNGTDNDATESAQARRGAKEGDDEEDPDEPNPQMRRRQSPRRRNASRAPGAQGAPSFSGKDSGTRAAATSPEWICSAAKDLPVNEAHTWDGPAATERILDDAGFNGDSPDPAKAKLGFLAWDHHNPKLKGSYKLPFADILSGRLTAVRGGLDAAASRLPDTDIPDSVKTSAEAVIAAYKSRETNSDASTRRLEAMRRRLRLAEAAGV